jgi:hypothetical protein
MTFGEACGPSLRNADLVTATAEIWMVVRTLGVPPEALKPRCSTR